MTHRRPKLLHAAAVALLALALLARPGAAQNNGTTSTLRYGSGLLDIPVATVLPHLTITGTYSGFRISIPNTQIIDRNGNVVGQGPAFEKWLSDGSIAMGLFNRAELGISIQHFDDPDEGGNLLGAFGRVSVLPASVRYLDLALGARYVTSPSFGDDYGNYEFQPSRFAFPDSRVYSGYNGHNDFSSNFTPYAVATATLPGFDAGPDYDITLNLGWGAGMFTAGSDLEFYRTASSNGIFMGSALNFSMGGGRFLNLMAEFNGFDTNAGLQVDFGGLRFGAFMLGLQHDGSSTIKSRKFGILGSIAFCAEHGGLCSNVPEPPAPDTVMLPAPPPDTVVIERTTTPPLPTGTPATICLATGMNVQVMLTAAGDTLVGPNRVSMRALGPGIVFAGAYAGDAEWFNEDEPVMVEERRFDKSGNPLRLDCGNIMQIAMHEGVPVFVERSAEEPYTMVYVPVVAGEWQGYEYGLQGTRGQVQGGTRE